MSEEKKFQRGGVTPEQEDTLKEVAGGALSVSELDAMASFLSKFTSNNCGNCAKCGKNCPYTPITMYNTLRGYETCPEHS